MKKNILILLLLTSIALSFECLGTRGRAQAEGGVAVIGDGATGLINPATTSFKSGKSVMAGYNYLFSNLDNGRLRRGYFGYNHRMKFFGNIGLYGGMTSDPVHSEGVAGINISYLRRSERLEWSIGVNPKMLFIDYRPEDGDYMPGRDGPPADDPLFADGTTKYGFNMDAGIFAKVDDRFQVGLAARDVLMTVMSIEGDGSSTMQPDFSLGASYHFHKYFEPFIDLSYRPETDNHDEILEPRAGIKSRYSAALKSTLGFNPRFATAGLTLHVPSFFMGFDLDYAFHYPISEVGRASSFSHYMGITLYLDRIRYTDIDLYILDLLPPAQCIIGDKNPYSVVIGNSGRKSAPSFSVTFYSLDSEGVYKTIFPTKFVDGLKPGEIDTLTWNFSPKEPGAFYLIASVDDNGTDPREITGVVLEDKEDNNRDSLLVNLTKQIPIGTVKPEFFATRAEKVELLEEEYPLIPIVFFPTNSWVVDNQADIDALSVIAERMKKNPDAELYIKAYVDPSDDEMLGNQEAVTLAANRIQAVYDELARFQPDISPRMVKENPETYDYLSPRIVPPQKYDSKQTFMIAAENRRVEFSVFTSSDASIPEPIELSRISNAEDVNFDLSASLLALIEQNPDAGLLLRGVRTEDEKATKAVLRAHNVELNLLKKYPQLRERLVAVGRTGAKSGIELELTFDGILYRPVTGTPVVENFTGLQHPKNMIAITAKPEEAVSSWKLTAQTPHEKAVFAEGDGLPPQSYSWDWQVDGRLIPPDTSVTIALGLTSPTGEEYEYISPPVEVNPDVKIEIIKKLILVEYVFDEATPTSRFLEGRITLLAREIIERAEREGGFDVEISGHTDVIGTERRNMELSRERAEREKNRLNAALTVLLETEDVSGWLSQRDVSIYTKGYGPSEPFVLQMLDGPSNIGDNNTPRGRTVNRRVIATFRKR